MSKELAQGAEVPAPDLRKFYDAACRAGLSSTEGRTYEEWHEKVSDYGLDDARQAYYAHQSVSEQAQEIERLRSEIDPIGNMPMVVKSLEYGAKTLAESVEMAIDRAYQLGRKDRATAAHQSVSEPAGRVFEAQCEYPGCFVARHTHKHVEHGSQSVGEQAQRAADRIQERTWFDNKVKAEIAAIIEEEMTKE